MSDADLINTLAYDPLTGHITWKQGTRRAGELAGCVTKRGHITIRRKNTLYQAHRIAWLLHYGEWPKFGIDHIDGNPGNNKINNLRDVPQIVNNKNSCVYRNSTTKVTGVSWCKMSKKWRAYISIAMKPVRLGYFTDFNEAVAARKAAEKQYNYHPNHGRNA